MVHVLWAIIAICALIIGCGIGANMVRLYCLNPCCQFLAAALSGRAADDFVSSLMQGERGEDISRLFYIFYKSGYVMSEDPEAIKFFALSVNDCNFTKRMLKRWLDKEVQK